MKASIRQLTDKPISHVTEQFALKEIQPVPGYLKRKDRFPRLPMEQANFPASMDVLYVNQGSTYTHESTMKGGLYYVDFHGVRASVEHDPQLEKTLEDQVKTIKFGGYSDVAPGAALYSSFDTPVVLTNQMVQDIEAGTARIYLAARADWKTNGIADYDNVCEWLQPSTWGNRPGWDPKKNDPIWHVC